MTPKEYIQHCKLYLRVFRNKLIPSHVQILKKFIEQQIPRENIFIVKSIKYGAHYSDCVWSNDNNTEGPDTCICYYTHHDFENITKIMTNYSTDLNIKSITIL